MTTARPQVDIGKIRITFLSDPAALSDFDCGERNINRNVGKCCDRHIKYRARVFCAFINGERWAYGFYCLSITATESKYLDEDIIRANENLPYVPFIYLNYIAVRQEFQNQKIGTLLLEPFRKVVESGESDVIPY